MFIILCFSPCGLCTVFRYVWISRTFFPGAVALCVLNLHLSPKYSERETHTDMVTIIKADPFLIKVVTTPTYPQKKPQNPNTSLSPQTYMCMF